MTNNVFIIAAISGFIATAGAAQTTAFTNQDASVDAVDDLEEAIEDDRERDLGRFGNEGRELGSYGSVAVRGTSVKDDDGTTTDIGLGLRYGTYDGINGIDLTASLAYGETDGEKTEDTLLAGVDYRRDLNDALFAFGKLEAGFDNMADDVGDFTQDIFVGAGLGYRIYNTADLQWSVQAGPGYRTAKRVDMSDVSEAAASVSSNVFKSLSEATYITNDTDVIYSETATTLVNELALNVAMTETLSLRTGYTTSFNSETDADLSEGVNTLGVSVIYNFN
ncbi:DUF481 domain-containing protein [Loktanella sp. S4079]|uniref:DUF481 domain-containing protein n=1 Tax=Loktanella sp. S4079 TaxID=579483 RepID=UPI0005FA9451|nr:DUF481 domain-containing protein [Loktanella sp. S4079]KJZ19130.1 hypothetical protein TW80_10015 [Loktanella sp. S4079]